MRAQTTIDFAIGISVFLLTAVLVFSFVPGMLQPFNAGAQEETVGSDRLASQLAEGMLADPTEPYILRTGCTVEFFRPVPNGPPDPSCAFNQSTDLTDADGLTDRVGMAPRQRINVTIRGTVGGTEEIICWDAGGEAIVGKSDSDCDQAFAAGDTPGTTGSVVTARRAVAVEGHDATLVVRMW